MKIKAFTFTVIALLAVSCIVQQPAVGAIEEYDYTISSEVKALSTSGGVDVIVDNTLQPGEVRVRTHTDVIESVEVYTKGATLYIEQTTCKLRPKVLEVRIPDYGYESVAASGGSDIVWCDCNVPMLTVAASGGADVEICGSSRQLDVAASGGADVSTERLVAEHVTVSASGGADVEVHATKSITILASGGADVTYSGNPEIKDINVSGGADVERDDD